MPTSTNYFKSEIIDYIKSNFDPTRDKILDIGCGVGTYANLLPEYDIDGVEAYLPYIQDYDLTSKYKNLIEGDVNDLFIDYSKYDLVILGDVLGHLELDEAKALVYNASDTQVIVAIPFLSQRDDSCDNDYEVHKQNDLTFISFFDKYPGFYPLCIRHDYGVFINRKTKTLYVEDQERALPNEYVEYLEKRFIQLEIKNIREKLSQDAIEGVNSSRKITYVTALWDLNRGSLGEGRTYDEYKDRFKELLSKKNINLFVYVDKEDVEFVKSNFKGLSLQIKELSLKELKSWTSFDSLIQKIRTDEDWKNQAGWLISSPQSVLEDYNNVVMSKPFMLNNARIWDTSEATHMYWIDAGISRTMTVDYLDQTYKIPDEKLCFIAFPYEAENEVHGFKYSELNRFSRAVSKIVLRGGFFGGRISLIGDFNRDYYDIMTQTLSEGLMGTEESLFTILYHRRGDLMSAFPIEENGLIYKFFQDLSSNVYQEKKTALYIITYNFPAQLASLLESMKNYDSSILDLPYKYLLDNSTDPLVDKEYADLCEKEGFIRIKKNNIGICGGRQFIAEHFDSTDASEYFFFEDDMNFTDSNLPCKSGFNRKIPGLIDKVIRLSRNNNYDFIKLSFSELFGDNSEQWAWNNVSEPFKSSHFGDLLERPPTEFKNIKIVENVPVATGEVYYSNWPQIVTRDGNKKMFLETKWEYPYEQTWMSHMYQETIKGNLKPAILLASPIEHERQYFYKPEERKEC